MLPFGFITSWMTTKEQNASSPKQSSTEHPQPKNPPQGQTKLSRISESPIELNSNQSYIMPVSWTLATKNLTQWSTVRVNKSWQW